METSVQGSISTHSPDTALIRVCAAILSEVSPVAFRPGHRRVPNLCLFCNRLFSSTEIRRHSPRCECNPRNLAPRWADKNGRSKRLTPHDLRAYLRQSEMLDQSPQGAD